MAQAYKVLGQANPTAATPADLYTVPAATETVVSTISATNRSGTASAIRISIAIDGAAEADTQWIVYDYSLAGNDTYILTAGISLDATDKIRVETVNATVTFQAFGVEIT